MSDSLVPDCLGLRVKFVSRLFGLMTQLTAPLLSPPLDLMDQKSAARRQVAHRRIEEAEQVLVAAQLVMESARPVAKVPPTSIFANAVRNWANAASAYSDAIDDYARLLDEVSGMGSSN
jgi:hypothetical protein